MLSIIFIRVIQTLIVHKVHSNIILQRIAIAFNRVKTKFEMGSTSSKEKPQKIPNKEEDLTALTKDLSRNGSPLQIPRMHPVDWKSGQVFTADDDPDRMDASNYQWNPPKFLVEKDPIIQREKLAVDEIDLSLIGIDPVPNKSSDLVFAKVIHNILEPNECAELIASVNDKGKFTRIFYHTFGSIHL